MTPQVHPGKKAAGERAAALVEPGMTIGLGTGSTAYWAIQAIGERVRDGLEIRAIATSIESEQMARSLRIPLVTFAECMAFDMDIDGADEVDQRFCLIKGGGGALLREKIIAAASRRMVVVADDSKWVRQLGAFPLPVEIIPFGWEITRQKVGALGCEPVLREKQGAPYLTDNGNYILDCSFSQIADPAGLEALLRGIPGVVESGLFIGMADTVILGHADGTTTLRSRPA